MSDDQPFDFTSYREGSGNLVPCKRCKRPIPASSHRCMHCGLHYQGTAADFAPGPASGERTVPLWIKIAGGILLVILALVVGLVVLGLPVSS